MAATAAATGELPPAGSILDCLEDLPATLRERIGQTPPPPPPRACLGGGGGGSRRWSPPPKPSFVLYLPTVVLRKEHNPAFAVACHLANTASLPLVVLLCALDDGAPLSSSSSSSIPPGGRRRTTTPGPVVMTARRLAFYLEGASSACEAWSAHGAAVAIRVHGPGRRRPDHLALCSRRRSAAAVITDEPFVDPWLGYCRSIERACRGAGVPCLRVDGSTTVPPRAVLVPVVPVPVPGPKEGGNGEERERNGGTVRFRGVPAAAWRWQKRTEGRRMDHVRAAVGGEWDAPELVRPLPGHGPFWEENGGESNNNDDDDDDDDGRPLPFAAGTFPREWGEGGTLAPGVRPWTAADLAALAAPSGGGIKRWALEWEGADATVPPCPQTVGTAEAGMRRWNAWVRDRGGLRDYARRRNDARQPHAPSRMSCYLNLGIVSVFRLVHEVKAAQGGGVAGAAKFEEEIVKWREMSYAHSFSRDDCAGAGNVPPYAARCLDAGTGSSSSPGPSFSFTLSCLESSRTGNEKWDAMQRYLVETGELHNNARMTWGKTLVHWGRTRQIPLGEAGGSSPTAEILRIMCYLNDRFALDGLSPPSYAGLLWCLGWCDKPGKGGGISQKPASRYKLSAQDFRQAQKRLLEDPGSAGSPAGASPKRGYYQGSILDMMKQGAKKRLKVVG